MPGSVYEGNGPAIQAWDATNGRMWHIRCDTAGNLITLPLQGAVQRVSAGYTAPGQTAKSFVGQASTSTTVTTTVTLGTVSAGKTMMFTDLILSTSSTTAIDVQLQAAGIAILRGHISTTASLQAIGMETQPIGTAGQALTLVLPITAGGVVQVNYSCYGIEQ